MEVINLGKRKRVELNLNGKECYMELTTKNIQHFQESNKIGLQNALDKMQKGNIEIALKLIYSMIEDKKTGKILGSKYFSDYDEFDIVQNLSPVLYKLIGAEMPEASNDLEKN